QLRRTLRSRGRGAARVVVAPGDRAAERGARAPRPLARAVGLRAARAPPVGRVDLAAALGAAVITTLNAQPAKRATQILFAGVVLLLGLASNARAGERYALIVTGASGGEVYEQKYAKWRDS